MTFTPIMKQKHIEIWGDVMSYNRKAVYEYAKKWAYTRNPKYYNYDGVGGDCTNFASQCMYAGGMPMNYKNTYGWFYINGNNKSPSWTGVEFLYKFLTTNNGIGPKGEVTNLEKIEVGDLIQLCFNGELYTHTLVVVKPGKDIYNVKIASHSYDAFNKALVEYAFKKIRYIHIK